MFRWDMNQSHDGAWKILIADPKDTSIALKKLLKKTDRASKPEYRQLLLDFCVLLYPEMESRGSLAIGGLAFALCQFCLTETINRKAVAVILSSDHSIIDALSSGYRERWIEALQLIAQCYKNVKMNKKNLVEREGAIIRYHSVRDGWNEWRKELEKHFIDTVCENPAQYCDVLYTQQKLFRKYRDVSPAQQSLRSKFLFAISSIPSSFNQEVHKIEEIRNLLDDISTACPDSDQLQAILCKCIFVFPPHTALGIYVEEALVDIKNDHWATVKWTSVLKEFILCLLGILLIALLIGFVAMQIIFPFIPILITILFVSISLFLIAFYTAFDNTYRGMLKRRKIVDKLHLHLNRFRTQ